MRFNAMSSWLSTDEFLQLGDVHVFEVLDLHGTDPPPVVGLRAQKSILTHRSRVLNGVAARRVPAARAAKLRNACLRRISDIEIWGSIWKVAHRNLVCIPLVRAVNGQYQSGRGEIGRASCRERV